jgi:hypothetical protein
MTGPDPHGQIALMLCESLMHVLVEAGVISKDKALAAVTTVVELSREMTEAPSPADAKLTTIQLIEMIAKSLDAKGAVRRAGDA